MAKNSRYPNNRKTSRDFHGDEDPDGFDRERFGGYEGYDAYDGYDAMQRKQKANKNKKPKTKKTKRGKK